VTPSQVAAAYDQLADRWHSDAFPFPKNGIVQHERAIGFLKRRGRALDVGCGASGRIVEHLLGHGFSVEGLDVSARMLELARQRHPHVEFVQADICRWQTQTQYDFISAWDSIWHVPLDQHQAVLAKLLRALTPGGVCIFSAGGLEGPSELTDSSMGTPMYTSVLGIPTTLQLIDANDCVCRHLEYDDPPQPHVSFIAQRRESA
jgi:2-polyprenyl-3-methyl-5-hydroxy-6-metoxy-1,4-benzoquinol methylase